MGGGRGGGAGGGSGGGGEGGPATGHGSGAHPDWAAKGKGTQCVHAGQEPDEHTGAVVHPIGLSTTFEQPTPGGFSVAGYEYSRSGNPTRDALQRSLAWLEGCPEGQGGALCFSSGLAATAACMQLLERGDRVLCADDVYGGTYRLLNKVCQPLMDVHVDILDLCKTQHAAGQVAEAHKLVWIETPTNPTLKLIDVRVLAAAAHAKGNLAVVDNTFATPCCQNPLELGADMMLHNITKFTHRERGHSSPRAPPVSTRRGARGGGARGAGREAGAGRCGRAGWRRPSIPRAAPGPARTPGPRRPSAARRGSASFPPGAFGATGGARRRKSTRRMSG